MKVLRKILASVIAASISVMMVVPVNAATINFDAKLSQIEALMQQCAAKGIDTSYEQVAYNTVKRTQAKLIADNTSGTDASIVSYNQAKMDQMLDTAISDMQAYLAGTKKAKRVALPNIQDTVISGAGRISGNRPVFSVGYGHQPNSLEPDVQDMNKFGSTNIHLEAGPAQIKSFSNPFNLEQNGTDVVVEYDASTSHSGTYSLKVTNNTEKSVSYARLTKNIPCEPNSKYVMSVWTKYETQNTDGLYLLMRRDWVEPTARIANGVTGTASQGWTNSIVTVTTDAGQTSFELSFIVEGKCTLWIDDMSIKKEGTSTELFYNGNLDAYDILDDMSSQMNTTILSAIQKAKANNVGVEFLLSPHYFPGTKYFQHTLKVAGVEHDTVDREASEGVFLSYNVANENAKRVMADYIKGLTEWFKKNNVTQAIDSIILSNEPIFRTSWYSDYYTPLFRSFLTEKYGTISALNSELGTSYSSFNAISMPDYAVDYTKRTGLDFDWVEFNDEVFVSWHEFLAKEVKKNINKPVSIKAGYAFEPGGENQADRLTKGYDFEKLGEFVDISGFDQTEMQEYPHTYWTNMMFFDYLNSVVKKPMYNSETHFNLDSINDGNGNFSYNEKTANHAGNHLWMSAIHGVDMFSNWCWDEGGHVPYTLLSRPDVINEIGKKALDMTRLSTNITDINNKKPQVAMFYSKSSRMYQPMHLAIMVDAYRTLGAMGVKVGFVTEDNLDLLDDYNALILPAVKYTTDAARNKVNAFIANGGKVLSINNKKNITTSVENPMSSDEHKNSASGLSGSITNVTITTGGIFSSFDEYNATGPNSDIASAVKSFVNSNITREITVTDGSGNEVSEIDWSYVVDGDSLTINVSNVDVNSTSKTLKFYLNGEQITGMNNMITGDTGVSTVTANLYQPVMLYIGATNQVTVDTSALNFLKKELNGRINVTNVSLMEGEKMTIKLEAYNSNDVIREYQYLTTIIPVGGTNGFKTMMPLASDVTYIKATVTSENGDILLAPATKLYLE